MPLRRRRHRLIILFATTVCAWMCVGPGNGAVVVVANHDKQSIQLDAAVDGDRPQRIQLAPGDARPILGSRSVIVRTANDGRVTQTPLSPDTAYAATLSDPQGQPILQRINLGESGTRPWPFISDPPLELPGAGEIPVKILVDEDERRPRNVWEPIIRARIDAASEVLNAHAGITLKVVAVDTWDSDNSQTDFFRSLTEFERKVMPTPARLAIGFSSQYAIAKGRIHLGGTRGPLHPHILLKERANNVLETERLELLVHELGHYLGASHSAEPTSVMRPVLGQGLQRAAGSHVQFDAANTLLMSLLAQEVRQRRVQDISQVTAPTRQRMAEIYRTMQASLPEDPAAEQYIAIVAGAGGRPLLEDAKRILAQIDRVAKLRHKMAQRDKHDKKGDAEDAPSNLESGDRILEFYVRQAALAAKMVRPENANRALLLALGVAFDDGKLLSRFDKTRPVVDFVEGPAQQAKRMKVFDRPTMRGSTAAAQHFFASAFLVSATGSEAARSATTVRELTDGVGGRDLNLSEVTANRAGLVFAYALLSGRLTLDDVAKRFSVAEVLPPTDETAARLDFAADDTPHSLRSTDLDAALVQIEAAVANMPLYRGSATAIGQ